MSLAPHPPTTTDFEQRVLAPLRRLRARTRLHLAVRGGLVVLLAIVGAAAVQLMLDRWLGLSLDQRVVFNIALTLVWLALVWRFLVRPLRRSLPNHTLAAWVDAMDPALDDRLQTAVEFAAGAAPSDAHAEPVSAELVGAVLAETSQRISPPAFDRVLDRRAFRQWLTTLAGIVTLVAGAFVLRGETMSIWFERNWLLSSRQWPQQTQLIPQGFDPVGRRRLPRGEEVDVVADVVGELPREVYLEWRTPSGRSGREAMNILGGRRVQVGLGVLTEDVAFRLRGGDEHTPAYQIEAVERPRVMHFLARVTPPAYTEMQPMDFEQQTALEAVAGSSIELTARVNRPLQMARFISDEGAALELGSAGVLPARTDEHETTLLLRWEQPKSGIYRFELQDVDGLSNLNPVRYTLKVLPDQPPNVELNLAGAGELATAEADLRLRVSAEDAFGLSGVELRAQRNADATEPVQIPPVTDVQRQFETAISLPAQKLRAAPGDRLRVQAFAADRDPAGPNRGESKALEIQVVSREDFEHALAERELELRGEFERLIAAQKSLHESFARIQADLPQQGPSSPRESQQLLGLMRRQASHAARCGALARRYLDMLEEMRTSKVARIADEQRITGRVASPLEQLERQTMPELSDAWGALREDATEPRRAAAIAQQGRVLREMDAVYRSMVEWEGFREAASTLAGIIEQQKEVRAATLAELDRQLSDILGPSGAESQRPSSQPIE